MSVAEIVEEIEKKRDEVNRLVIRAIAEGLLPDEDEPVLRTLNEQLARRLSLSFIGGEALMKLNTLDDPTEALVLHERAMSDEQAFVKMRFLIEEDHLGSKFPDIRRTAIELVNSVRGSIAMPLAGHELYRPLLSEDCPEDSEELGEGRLALAKLYELGAQAIYDFVRTRIDYVSEGDEYFQRAQHTLMVKGGDCDDVAILTACLLRSIGCSVYLKFLPGHVLAGVVLLRLRHPVAVKTLPPEIRRKIPRKFADGSIFPREYVYVPLDTGTFLLTATGPRFDVFDIFTGRFEGMFRETITESQKTMQEVMDKKGVFNRSVERITSFSDPHLRFPIPDPPFIPDPLTIVTETSQLLAIQANAVLSRESVSAN